MATKKGKAIKEVPEGEDSRVKKIDAFREDLAALINKHSMESLSNTPDFILAQHLTSCLLAFETTSKAREDWYGVEHSPGRRHITR